MSFYDQASLILIPSGYKDSKLYCAKPTDGSGDLTFSRTGSTATRVNESGLIEKCRTNLVLNSATLVTQNVTVVAAPYTLSIFGTGSVTLSGTGSGTLTGTGAGNRVSLTFTPTAGTLILTVSGSVTSAQLEIGDIVTNYIPTTSTAVTVGPIANMPRLDYTGGGCPKLLMEPTRTNLCFYSEQFDNDYYIKTNGVISSNFTTSPDGHTSADKYIVNSGAASNSPIIRMISFAANTTHTFSLFVKKANYDTASIRISTAETGVIANFFDLSSGTATSNQIQSYGNGWYRVWVSLTTAATVTSGQIQLIRDAQIRDGVAGIFIWGAQVEAGTFASSYIPTNNATVTRNADICSKTGISSLIGQTEGTMFVDITVTTTSTTRNIFAIDINATTNFIAATLSSVNVANFIIRQSGSSTTIISSSALSLGRHKLAFAYKSGQYALYIDGTQIGTSTSTVYPVGALDQLVLSSVNYGQLSDGYSQTILFPTRLSNSQLATLTTL